MRLYLSHTTEQSFLMRPYRDKNGKRIANRNVQIVLNIGRGILCLWCVCVCTHALAGMRRRGSPKGSLKAVKMNVIPGSGSAHGGGNGNPFQYSCLENSMDRGVSGATVHGVTKSQTQLSLHTCSIYVWSSHWRPQVPSIAVCLDMPFSRLCALTDRNGVD